MIQYSFCFPVSALTFSYYLLESLAMTFCFLRIFFDKTTLKIITYHKKCSVWYKIIFSKIFYFFSLLLSTSVIKYTCKSVGDNRIEQFAHHFPPYHMVTALKS